MNKINNKLCCLMQNNDYFVKNIRLLISLVQKSKINTSAFICRESNTSTSVHLLTVAHVFKYWRQKFKHAGISEPKQSIQFILAHIFKLNKISDLYWKFPIAIDVQTQNQIEIMCKKRLLKMPVQYILGEWQFRELTLKMEPPVFIPRPETEQLIDIILGDLKQFKNKINTLEICCGSGAISLALLKNNSNIEVTALDKSKEACNLSMKNVALHELNHRIKIRNYEINEKNLLKDVEIKFDVIVSNPPYVPTKDVETVQPEIKFFEDLDALDGGPDGLNIIKPIILLAKEKLVENGKLYLETDPSHPPIISHFLQSHPELRLNFVKSYKDFCNKERFVKIEKI